MDLRARIEDDVKQAMRDGRKDDVAVLRMLKSKLQEREVALRSDRGRDYRIDDEEATRAVAAYAKQRRDSIASYREAGRDDLADREARELALVEGYLPKQLGDDELRALVRAAIEETGATEARQMGLVMKAVMPKLEGRADGKRVNAVVRELLAG